MAFSSLTPHMTGPNLTSQVRKTYIVQFALDGASMITLKDGEQSVTICNAPDRQYSILVDGKTVAAER